MKNRIKTFLKQELSWAYVGLFICLVFTAVGIGLIITGVRGGGFDHIASTVIISILASCFWGFSIFLLIQCLKRLVPYYQSLKALKHGIEDTATMCGHTYRSISHLRGSVGSYRTYYSVHLRFFDNEGHEVIYKTAHNYDSEQFKLLQAKSEIKIKKYKNTAVIVEDFDELEYEFSELPKKLRIKSILVVVLAYISLALIFAGITCLCIFNYTKWAVGIFVSGIILILISAISKAFINYETEKFIKNELPNIRKANRKAKKRERWKEQEKNRHT
ncbi:MAG: hypothetical protein K2N74_05565 [Clostridiales bacterium]|nr:hypothetical protein [Clostridiales bacterium]